MIRNRIAWGAVLAAAALLYFFENNAGTLALLAALAALPLLSGLMLALPRYRVTAALTLPEAVTRGESAEGMLTLTRAGGKPLRRVTAALALDNALTGEHEALPADCRIPRGAPGRTAFVLHPAHCGTVRVRIASLTVRDPLGLFVRRLPDGGAEARLCVLPRLSPVTAELAETGDLPEDTERWSQQRPGNDPGETFGIREYVPGDPLRLIHWKLSEKTDRLQVRELGLPEADRLLLLLETAGADADTLDGMLDLLASVSEALAAAELAHTVGWRDGAGFAEYRVENRAETRALTERIGSAHPDGGTAVSALLAREARIPYAHAAVFAAGLLPDTAALQQGNRVTALLPADRTTGVYGLTSGVETVLYTPETLRSGAMRLML